MNECVVLTEWHWQGTKDRSIHRKPVPVLHNPPKISHGWAWQLTASAMAQPIYTIYGTHSIGSTHNKPSYHTYAGNHPLTKQHCVLYTQYTGSVFYSMVVIIMTNINWLELSSRNFWIFNMHVHQQTTAKHSKFIIPHSHPGILCTDAVEIHKEFSALYPSAVSQHRSAQVSKHILLTHTNHFRCCTGQ
jgi:hypothetical protein